MRKIKGIMILLLTIMCFLPFCHSEEVEAASSKKKYYLEAELGDNAKANTRILNNRLQQAGYLAQKEGRTYTVKVKAKNGKNSYKIHSSLRIYSNTVLDVRGIKLTYTSDKFSMLAIHKLDEKGEPKDSVNKIKGYGIGKNITILGGTWNADKKEICIMKFFHCSNITLNGCTFIDSKAPHQVEVAAIDGFNVIGCTFKGMKKRSEGGREALQLDVPVNQKVFPRACSDGTPTKNVKIKDCHFEKVPRGVGSHSVLIGNYFENIDISNNTFYNVEDIAINATNYRKCKISGNTMKNCGIGIKFVHYYHNEDAIYSTPEQNDNFRGQTKHNMDVTISNNSYVSRKPRNDKKSEIESLCGIKVIGFTQKKAGKNKKLPIYNYYITGITIKNNKISSYKDKNGKKYPMGYGIYLSNIKDANKNNVSGNKIYDCNIAPIRAHVEDEVSFYSNTIKGKNKSYYAGSGKNNRIIPVSKVSKITINQKGNKLYLSLEKSNNTLTCMIEYSKSNKFNKKVRVVTKKNSVVITLKTKGTYYVRARGTTNYNKISIYSAWTKPQKIIVK